jgi:hypothetical protein
LLIVGLPTTTKQVVSFIVLCSQLPEDPFFSDTFDSTLVAPFLLIPKVQIPETRSCPASTENTITSSFGDSNGMNEFAALLYSKVNNLEQEGLKTVCLMQKITNYFSGYENIKCQMEVELYVFFFYADRVFKGLDAKRTVELGWYLPENNRM